MTISYDKANSLSEIRQKNTSVGEARSRMKTLQGTLAGSGAGEYFTAIVRQACQEALCNVSISRGGFYLRPHVVEEIRHIPNNHLARYLFYRYRYDMFPQEKRLDNFPPCLQIEPSSLCNYRCVFCYQTDASFNHPKEGHMGTMSLDLFKRVVDQAKGHCESVTLASRGEPLMCRDIESMLFYASGKFLALKLNTNAWFLDEKKAHVLLQTGLNTLVFSVDAASEPLYSRLRVNGRLDRVLKNIGRFQQIRAKHYSDSKLITRVSGVRFTKEQSMDEMVSLWGDLVDQVAFVDYNPWENVYENPLNGIIVPCSDLWRRMFVWFDGNVNPCDVDYKSTLSVGHGLRDELSVLWRGKVYNDHRERHLKKLRQGMSPCKRCTVI